MSRENVELVREAIEAFNRGDLERALERMHPDIEWRTLDAFPDAGTYRGREDVREFWHAWRDTFESIAPAGVRAGGRALRACHLPSKGRGSRERSRGGVPRCLQLGMIRDGHVIWVGMFSTESEALEAAELEE